MGGFARRKMPNITKATNKYNVFLCTKCGEKGRVDGIGKKTSGGIKYTLHFRCPHCLYEEYIEG